MTDLNTTSAMQPVEPPVLEKTKDALVELKRKDDARPGIPGEHLFVLAAGIGLWLVTANHRSTVVRTLGLLGATALVGRAASGRDGVMKLLRYLPIGSRIR